MTRGLFGPMPPDLGPAAPSGAGASQEVARDAERRHTSSGRRLTNLQAVFLALLSGPVTSAELARITPRYGARIYELRRRFGCQIETAVGAGGASTYTMLSAPAVEEVVA
jgi:hypothetical protein